MKHLAILFLSLQLTATSTYAATEELLRTITVTGNAEIMVAPDEAVLRLGVEILRPELEEAKGESDRIVTAVLAAAEKSGVSKEHLKTDYLQIQPEYRVTHNERVLLGYDVRQTIVVTVVAMDGLEDVLSSALEAGANQVHGIEFRSSNPRKHMDEARNQALDAATEKAKAMAGRLGQKIGRPITIAEESARSFGPSPFNSKGSAGVFANGREGSIVAGRISITAKVSVEYELID